MQALLNRHLRVVKILLELRVLGDVGRDDMIGPQREGSQIFLGSLAFEIKKSVLQALVGILNGLSTYCSTKICFFKATIDF